MYLVLLLVYSLTPSFSQMNTSGDLRGDIDYEINQQYQDYEMSQDYQSNSTYDDNFYSEGDNLIYGLLTPDEDTDPLAVCWTTCADVFGEDIRCSGCPEKRPVRRGDLDLKVTCYESSALMSFSLEKVLAYDLENLTVTIQYKGTNDSYIIEQEDISTDSLELETNKEWINLCSGVEYDFCVSIYHEDLSALDDSLICQVCTYVTILIEALIS